MATDLPPIGLLYRFAANVAFLVFRLQAWRIRVTGLDNVPRSGGAVIVANHTGFWDFFTIGWAPYRRHGRPVRILAKASLFHVPVFGFLMRRARHIPVERGAGTHAYDAAVAALQRGELILVLPEQTISRSFELLPFKSGAARMAAAAGVPVIPAVSWGSHRFHTAGHRMRWKWRLPVDVAFGPAWLPAPDADPVTVTAELQSRVHGLLESVWDGYPDQPSPDDAWWVPASRGGSAPTHDEALADLARRVRRRRSA